MLCRGLPLRHSERKRPMHRDVQASHWGDEASRRQGRGACRASCAHMNVVHAYRFRTRIRAIPASHIANSHIAAAVHRRDVDGEVRPHCGSPWPRARVVVIVHSCRECARSRANRRFRKTTPCVSTSIHSALQALSFVGTQPILL